MKFLSMMIMLASVLFATAQTDATQSGGVKVDKKGAEVKTKKGGKAAVSKKGAEAKGPKGKGVEADKNGTRTTPKKTN